MDDDDRAGRGDSVCVMMTDQGDDQSMDDDDRTGRGDRVCV